MKSKRFYLLLLTFFSVYAKADLVTVPYVDPARYVGTWYQIARNPLPFEDGCVCSRQVLTAEPSGVLGVYNSCNSETITGAIREIRGTATNDDPQGNARFTVDFGLPFKGQYWIIGLDPQYRYAVVSDPSKRSLYILSKTPQLDSALYDRAVSEVENQIDVSRLLRTVQKGCVYPASVKNSAAPAPTDPAHPGSKSYSFGFEKKDLTCSGRAVSVFSPLGKKPSEKFPVVVFGHGQSLDLPHYKGTLEHLARKGVIAVFPMYDTGFFDQDWSRMGRDYVNVTACALDSVADRVNKNQIVFAGHSKGAYVASVASGLAFREGLSLKPKSIVLFGAAGIDRSSIDAVSPTTSATIVFSEADSVVQKDISDSLYRSLPSKKKQFIFMKNYPDLKADHLWPLTQGSFFGGGSESALHYYGGWKWLTAAAWDLRDGAAFKNPYLYGDQAGDKGVAGLRDEVVRNW